MLLTHTVKLLPTDEQKVALLETMERFNEACNFAAAAAFRIQSANKMRLQKEVYYALREKFGLPAQLAIRAIAKTRDDLECVRCGFAGPADHVAARNIAAGGLVNGPIVTGDFWNHVGHLSRKPMDLFAGS